MWTYRHTQTGFYEPPFMGEYSSDFYESLPVNDGSEKDKNPSHLVSVLGNILEQEEKRGKELSEERLRLITKLDDLQNELSLLIENYGGDDGKLRKGMKSIDAGLEEFDRGFSLLRKENQEHRRTLANVYALTSEVVDRL